MPVTIRPATSRDAAAIAAIYNDAVVNTTATFDTETKSAENRRAWLAARATEHPVFVAVLDDEVVGWGAFSAWSDRIAYRPTVEMSVYVAPEHHRQGVGLALAETLLGQAPRSGVHHIISRICSENTASLAMADKLGFRRVGTMHEVGKKFDRWLDVVVGELIIGD